MKTTLIMLAALSLPCFSAASPISMKTHPSAADIKPGQYRHTGNSLPEYFSDNGEMQASFIPLPMPPTAICIPKDTAAWLHNHRSSKKTAA